MGERGYALRVISHRCHGGGLHHHRGAGPAGHRACPRCRRPSSGRSRVRPARTCAFQTRHVLLLLPPRLLVVLPTLYPGGRGLYPLHALFSLPARAGSPASGQPEAEVGTDTSPSARPSECSQGLVVGLQVYTTFRLIRRATSTTAPLERVHTKIRAKSKLLVKSRGCEGRISRAAIAARDNAAEPPRDYTTLSGRHAIRRLSCARPGSDEA
jgi:hypothetical protein